MSWATPPTAVTGAIITAADANTVRDDLNETAPAKVTTAGDLVQGTAANAIARLALGTQRTILEAGATTVAWGTAKRPVVNHFMGAVGEDRHVESGRNLNTGAVTFADAYGSTPSVVVGISLKSAVKPVPYGTGVTTTGFTIGVQDGDASDRFDWIAEGAD